MSDVPTNSINLHEIYILHTTAGKLSEWEKEIELTVWSDSVRLNAMQSTSQSTL